MKTRTVSEWTRGKLTLRLLETKDGFLGVLIGDPGGQPAMIRGSNREEVTRRLEAEVGKHHPNYFGYDGARARFLREFPEGFADPAYLETERSYKLDGKARLEAAAPLSEASSASGLGPAVLRVFADKKMNLLPWRETSKLKELLTGPSADAFVQAAAAFTLGAGATALAELDHLLRPYDCAKWTIVTYLPYLWRPDRHMFLKPTNTTGFAFRVGHPFARAYDPRLDMTVYESLLDLVAETEKELADLHPRDRIDVQSFIWVIGQPEPEAEAHA